MIIDPCALNWVGVYKLLVSAVAPRPIALVATVDDSGIFNLAPFSIFSLVSIQPPLVGFGVVRNRDGSKKDTLLNIESSKDFSINIVNEHIAAPMNYAAKGFPKDIDEFKETGLTPLKSGIIKSPLVVESPVMMECSLNQILEFGGGTRVTSFIIGEVVRFHVKNELWADGAIDPNKLRAIARLGGDFYCRTSDLFEMKRPD